MDLKPKTNTGANAVFSSFSSKIITCHLLISEYLPMSTSNSVLVILILFAGDNLIIIVIPTHKLP